MGKGNSNYKGLQRRSCMECTQIGHGSSVLGQSGQRRAGAGERAGGGGRTQAQHHPAGSFTD